MLNLYYLEPECYLYLLEEQPQPPGEEDMG